MNSTYNLSPGQKVKFSLVIDDIEVMNEYVKTNILSLASVKAFSILDRITGLIIKKRTRTLLVFYQEEDAYKVDNNIICEKLQSYFSENTGSLELLSFDMDKRSTLELLQSFIINGIEIYEKE